VNAQVRRLLVDKPSNTAAQFVRYLFVGGAAAVMDTATLLTLNRRLGVNHLLAAAVGFLVGLGVNYLISIAWVFQSRGRYRQELLLFAVIGLGGLALTELIMWVTVDVARFPVFGGKFVALGLVLLWNFGMRRKLVFAGSDAGSDAGH